MQQRNIFPTCLFADARTQNMGGNESRISLRGLIFKIRVPAVADGIRLMIPPAVKVHLYGIFLERTGRPLPRVAIMATAPGKAHREGISLMELTDLFPDKATAKTWFESLIWPAGRHSPGCGSDDTREATATFGLPHYCSGYHKPFSARIGGKQQSAVPHDPKSADYLDHGHPRFTAQASELPPETLSALRRRFPDRQNPGVVSGALSASVRLGSTTSPISSTIFPTHSSVSSICAKPGFAARP